MLQAPGGRGQSRLARSTARGDDLSHEGARRIDSDRYEVEKESFFRREFKVDRRRGTMLKPTRHLSLLGLFYSNYSILDLWINLAEEPSQKGDPPLYCR